VMLDNRELSEPVPVVGLAVLGKEDWSRVKRCLIIFSCAGRVKIRRLQPSGVWLHMKGPAFMGAGTNLHRCKWTGKPARCSLITETFGASA